MQLGEDSRLILEPQKWEFLIQDIQQEVVQQV